MIYLPFRKEDIDKYRIFFQRGFTSGHQGTDWGMNNGTPLIAVEDGTIVLNTKDQYGGLFTRLVGNSGKQYEYVHLSKYGVNPNTKVKAGQIIGYAGATGNATGPHLHLNYYTKPGAGRSNFMSLNPTYFNYNPLPPMTNRNDVYNLYKASVDKHKAKAKAVRPDVSKAYGDNFYWEHMIQFSNEYHDAITAMRSLSTENANLKAELAKLKPNADLVKALDRINETLKTK